jgi:hypothetical protein
VPIVVTIAVAATIPRVRRHFDDDTDLIGIAGVTATAGAVWVTALKSLIPLDGMGVAVAIMVISKDRSSAD